MAWDSLGRAGYHLGIVSGRSEASGFILASDNRAEDTNDIGDRWTGADLAPAAGDRGEGGRPLDPGVRRRAGDGEDATNRPGRDCEPGSRSGRRPGETRLGQASLEAFAQGLDRWSEGGALEIEILEKSPERLDFNVTRCKYAEMYRALGLADLGGSLSCLRDHALIEGFNPDVTLTRTQTIMEGASHCDFRFRTRGEK